MNDFRVVKKPFLNDPITHSHTNDLQGMHKCRDQLLKFNKPWESLNIKEMGHRE